MYTLLFGNKDIDDSTMAIPLADSFKVEGDWLKAKRQELVDKDKNGAKRMLVNNPTREISKNVTVLS